MICNVVADPAPRDGARMRAWSPARRAPAWGAPAAPRGPAWAAESRLERHLCASPACVALGSRPARFCAAISIIVLGVTAVVVDQIFFSHRPDCRLEGYARLLSPDEQRTFKIPSATAGCGAECEYRCPIRGLSVPYDDQLEQILLLRETLSEDGNLLSGLRGTPQAYEVRQPAKFLFFVSFLSARRHVFSCQTMSFHP